MVKAAPGRDRHWLPRKESLGILSVMQPSSSSLVPHYPALAAARTAYCFSGIFYPGAFYREQYLLARYPRWGEEVVPELSRWSGQNLLSGCTVALSTLLR